MDFNIVYFRYSSTVNFISSIILIVFLMKSLISTNINSYTASKVNTYLLHKIKQNY